MAKIRVKNVFFNIFAIVTVIAVGFVCFTFVTHTRGYAVTSNSMADRLNVGDAVFSRPVSFDELKPGDIVTVKVGNSGYFTHRVVDIDIDNRTVTTKGDANDVNDPQPTEAKCIVGRMWFSVPYLGYLSILFTGASHTTVLIILVIIASALIAVNSLLNKRNKMRGDSNE